MNPQRSQLYMCIGLALVASVSSASNWPTTEFFERHYHGVAPASGDLTSNPGQTTNIGNANSGSTAAPVASVSTKDGALRTPAKRHFQYATVKISPSFSHQFDPLHMYMQPYMFRPPQLMYDEQYRPPMYTLMDTDFMGDAFSGQNLVALLHPRTRSLGHWPYSHETKALKPRWSSRRRLSAREAVAVMEQELEQREAAKTINTPIKDDTEEDAKEDIQPAASENDSVVAPSNRRSGHHMGITGPVHTFVKTDKHGHYKWGVRHHAGHGFS